MNSFRSSNPALRETIFARSASYETTEVMTYRGTMNKTLLMLLLVILGASYTWRLFFESLQPESVTTWMAIGGIGGLITALITIFVPKASPYTAPIYALTQGLFLGGISAILASQFGTGIIIQAVGLTFSTFFLMLMAFRSGAIRVTGRFRRTIMAATGAIALTYFFSFILGLFGINIGFIHNNGTIGIIFSLVVVGVAAFNLILDFDFIERASAMGAPKQYEWYGAFGLMVTLIWLYIEFLKLLSKFTSRD